MANNGLIVSGNLGIGTLNPIATLEVTRNSGASSGSSSYVTVTQAADTAQTASTESPTVLFNFDSATRTWDVGALAIQRFFRIDQPTINFDSSNTSNDITNVATVGIVGAPLRGANCDVVSNTHGILISAAAVSTATNSYGLSVNAQTGATNNYAAQFIGGSVGIGTATPNARLEVTAGGNAVMDTPATTSLYGIYLPASGAGGSTSSGIGVGESGNISASIIGYDDGASARMGWRFLTGPSTTPVTAIQISSSQTVHIGVESNATAVLQLKAGTATASTAPLKFTSGTNLTSPEAGAVEWNGTTLFLTNSVPTRQAAALMSSSFLTQYGVVLGAGTATLSVTAAGTTGQVLIGNTGADPSWAALSSIGVTSITGTANQIAASASTGAVTLSLTNGISIGSYQATASPTGGIIAPGDVGIGTASPSYLVHAYGNNEAIVIEDPNSLGSASLRAWASQDGTPATNGDAILQLAGKQSAGVPDTCWYIGLDGSTGAGNFDPNLKIGFSSGWAVPGAGDKVTILTSGLVGIGTTGPEQTLTVRGAVGITGNSNLPAATGSSLFLAGAFGSPILGRIFVGDGTGWYLALSKRLASSTTDLFYFLDTGRLGIGTAAAASTLSVLGNTSIGATYAAIAAPTSGLIVEGNVGIGISSPTATAHITRSAVATSGVQSYLQVDQVADTAQTASTESPTVLFNFDAATRTWATGALTTQRYFRVDQPTIAFAGASTVTNVANIGVVGAPIKGTNATVTNTHGILISAGAVSTATNSYGLSVNAQTGATNNYAAQFIGGNVGIGTAAPVNSLDVGAGAVIGASVAGATTAPTNGLIVQGSLVMNTAALATNATDGFIYESTCAGTPTGTPTSNTGRSAIVIDTTNNIPYFYNSSWKCANGKVLINSNVLGASAATVTFSSIPGVFNHLTIKGVVRCTNAATFATIYMQFNGDTGANYNRQFMRVRNATFSGGCAVAVTQAYIADVCASTAAANYASNFVTSINCYSQTTFYKVYNTAATNLFSTAADSFTESWSGSWANTAAITSITFGELAGGSIDAGSAFYIYGEI